MAGLEVTTMMQLDAERQKRLFATELMKLQSEAPPMAGLTCDILEMDCVRLDGGLVVFQCVRRLRESNCRGRQNTSKKDP